MANMRLFTSYFLALTLFAEVHSGFGQLAPREDDEFSPSPWDAIIDQAIAGDLTAFNLQPAVEQPKIIRRMKDRIAIQCEPDDAYALSVGRALVKMHAEEPLRELIVNLTGDGYNMDREIDVIFYALPFMKSKASVRVLASFLNDPQETIINDQFELLLKMDQSQQKAYLDVRPRLSAMVSSCSHTGKIALAQFSLSKMSLPGRPKWHKDLAFPAGALEQWRDWWKANKASFDGDGPLPSAK